MSDLNVTTNAVELPFQPSIDNYRFSCPVNDRLYLWDVRWNPAENEGEGAWYLDIRNPDESVVAIGIKIVLGAYLGRRVAHPLFTEGVLVAIDLSGEKREATFDDLGTRVIVEYIPVLELIFRLQSFDLI